jgi:hypothetical protein
MSMVQTRKAIKALVLRTARDQLKQTLTAKCFQILNFAAI